MAQELLDKVRRKRMTDEKDLQLAQKLIAEECDKVKELLLEKNRKYGNAALQPRRIFSKANALEQIRVRMDDKINRIMNMQPDDMEDPKFDLLGYIILERVAKRLEERAKADELADDVEPKRKSTACAYWEECSDFRQVKARPVGFCVSFDNCPDAATKLPVKPQKKEDSLLCPLWATCRNFHSPVNAPPGSCEKYTLCPDALHLREKNYKAEP